MSDTVDPAAAAGAGALGITDAVVLYLGVVCTVSDAELRTGSPCLPSPAPA